MNLIKFLLRNSKEMAILTIVSGVVGGLSSAGLIAIIHATLSNPEASPGTLLVSYFGLCLLMLCSNIVSQVLLLRLSQGAIFDLRLRLCRQILKAPLQRIEEAGSPRLMTALSGDANAVSQALYNVPLICIHLATLTASMIYVAWLSKALFFGLLVFLLVGLASYRLPLRRGMRYMARSRVEMERLFAHFRALTDGNKELKLHRTRREEFIDLDLQASAVALRRNMTVGMSIYISAEAWGRLLYFIFIGAILFLWPMLSGDRGAALMGYVLVVLYLMGPIGGLLMALPTFTQAQVALKRLEELGLSLKAEDPEPEPAAEAAKEAGWNLLQLNGVTHTYRSEGEDSTFTLGPLDLSFRPGELVFLVGGNGSGKSTLAKLLTGLYIPDAGSVELDGRVITDDSREEYRQLFTAIFSDFYLFERIPGASTKDRDAQARKYIAEFQLAEKVTVESGRLTTPGLSSGQRKRLALLTAYMEDRPFYVFDEWASDQDPFFRNVFYTQLLPELRSKGKTVLVISHDDRYYHLADRIIKLDYGQYTNN